MRLRRKMHYFVVFQPSKVEMPIFSASILINLTHFPRWLRKSAIKIKKNSENLSRMGASIRAKMHRLGMEGKSQIDSHLSHRKTKRYFTRWKVMCFCVIEFEKRSHRIAQDIFLFLLWTSDTLPVQSSCFAPEMISLLRKAKIIFQEPVVITATTSNKLTVVIAAITSNKLDTYMYFSWDNRVKGSKGRRRRKGGWGTSPAQIISHANHLKANIKT